MNNIVLYGAVWCPSCQTAKKYFEKKQVKFTYYDVDSEGFDMRNFMNTYNVRSLPLIIINNKPILGFNEQKIKELLTVS